MKMILVLGSIIFPLIMFYSTTRFKWLNNIYNFVAIIATLVFGNIASVSIYTIIKEKTVFMTAIHAIFLNPFFLMTGAYLGVFILFKLILISIKDFKED